MLVGRTGKDLLDGRSLLPCCLLLMLAEVPRHGYQLVEQARTLDFEWGHPTSLYRALHRLESSGLLRSEWQHGGRSAPARRVYVLTAEGHDALATCAAQAAVLSTALRDYGRRYEALGRRPPRPGDAASPPE